MEIPYHQITIIKKMEKNEWGRLFALGKACALTVILHLQEAFLNSTLDVLTLSTFDIINQPH